MKKFFSRFVKNEKGVVMMEYILLGCFSVAVTVISCMVLGSAYGSGLNTMSLATVGDAAAANYYLHTARKEIANNGINSATAYTNAFDKDNVGIGGTNVAHWNYTWDK